MWPNLFACRAAFVEPPRAGDELPPARIELGDGTSVMSDAADVDAVLSRFFGRDVELARAAQNGYTIDQYHPDEENYDPEGTRLGRRGGIRCGVLQQQRAPSAVPEGSFFDLFPFSVLTTSTLDQLGELEPQSRFDARRFRMNVIVDTSERGFVENEWVGHTLAIGDDNVRLGVALPDPRCVMPSLAQEDLARDPRILKALARHNRIDVAGARYPCAGVYAVAEATGTIHKGDHISLV